MDNELLSYFSFTTAEGKQTMIVNGGVVEVKDNVIVLLAEKEVG
jgi:F-type H+-transporting ATPase subunit epsilon